MVLDLRAELNLNGWTDITADDKVYQRDPVNVSRGRADESSTASPSSASLTLDNRTGDFSPRNPSGSYYGSLGRNTPLRLSVPDQDTYLRLEDDLASNVTTPDSVALSITGDIEIQIDVKPSGYATQALAAKWNPTSGTTQNSWVLFLNSTGLLQFFWSTTGADFPSAQSTAPLPLGRIAIKVTLDVNNGASGNTVTFYTAPSLSGSWTQLGDPVVGVGTTSIFDSTTAVSVGNYTVPETNGFQGRIYGFKLLSGIGGTVKAFADFTSATAGSASYTDAQSNVWTLQGSAEFSDRNFRFHGEVASWPQKWDVSETDVYVPIQAGGITRRLGQGSNPLDSVLKRYWSTLTGSLAPVAYWPAEDGNSSTQIASGIGGPAMQVSGSPTFASDTGFAASGALPVVNNSTWKGTVPRYTTSGTDIIVRFLMHVPSAGETNNTRIVRLYTSGSVNEFSLYYTTGGGLGLVGYDNSGASLFDTGAVAFGINNDYVEVSMELRKSGANIAYSLTTLAPGASSGSATSGTLTTASVGHATALWVGPNGDLVGTALGHITIQSTWDSLFNYGDQLNAHAGETAGSRFTRLCGEEGVAYRIYGYKANTRAMGAQGQKTLLDLLQECEDADGGMLYEPRDSISLGYRTRESMENQTAAVTLDYSNGDLDGSNAIEPVDDDQFTRNDVTVQRTNGTVNGSSSRQVDSTSALSVNAPPDGVGTYSESVSANLYLDSQVDDQAGWRLHLGTVDEPRYPTIPLNLTVLSGDKHYDVLYLDQGDFIDVENLPTWLPPGDLKQLVSGFKENLGGVIHTLQLNCVPESPYEVGVVGSGVASDNRVDTDGSTLSANATSGATSISVAVTSSSDYAQFLWTTVAGDFPFDILVGGEQMTVTNITGSSSPQTFTVTRSVNGITKAHSSGDAVSIYQPTIVALSDPY